MSGILDILRANHLVDNFINESISGKLSHAYLIVGGDEITTLSCLDLASSVIFCDTKNACGTCINCQRLSHSNHPNLHKYSPDKGLKSADVEDIIATMNRTPLIDGVSVYVITNADRMNEVAQNKLLKTLEEPHEDIIILLGATNDNALLSTIKSRVKLLHLNIWNTDNITTLLTSTQADIAADKIAFAADMAVGSLERARQLLTDDKAYDKYLQLTSMLQNLDNSSQTINYLGILGSDSECVLSSISMLERIFNKMLRDHINGQKSGLNAKYSLDAIVNINDLILTQYKKLKANCQVNSIEDSLLLGILEMRYKLG